MEEKESKLESSPLRKLSIREIFLGKDEETPISVTGWVRSVRKQKDVAFVMLFDTTGFKDLQVVAPPTLVPAQAHVHSTITVEGTIVYTPHRVQSLELKATSIAMCGDTSEHDPLTYPLAKTKLPMTHLRQYPHLRIRSRTMQSVMRISSTLSMATHTFFQSKHMHQVFTPIMTGSDCEGGGEVFEVKANNTNTTGSDEPFFESGNKFLTVSGQLELESYACGGLGNCYTFGPCFRAEKSKTNRHLSEFWMVEVELIQLSLEQLMDFSEEYVRFCIYTVLEKCKYDLNELNIPIQQLQALDQPFYRISYREAIAKLGVPFGTDLSSDQEKLLLELLAKERGGAPRPTFVIEYPQSIKAFYMKPSVQDGSKDSEHRPPANSESLHSSTVQSFDLLCPNGVQELIGGSIREDSLSALKAVMVSRGMKISDFQQYLDTRRYGSIPHGGFGLGFGRLVMLCTGMESIRDVTPFPVYYGC